MRAVVFDRVGPPEEVLAVRDVPTPTPGRGEVLVRMRLSPINPSDLMYVRGQYGLKPETPATPGFEGVGVVEASGGGLLGWFRVGKRVAVINDRRGNWSELTVTSARQVVPVPADIPDELAASYFVNPMTALVLLEHVLKAQPGDWLMQTAAGGALGRMIVRLAKRSGVRTLNVVRRPEHVEELKRLGADEVVLESDPLPDRAVPFILDPVGGDLATRVLDRLAHGGRMVIFGSLTGQPVRVDPRALIIGSKSVEGFWLADWMKKQRVLKLLRLFRRVGQLTREGVLATDVGRTFPLDQVREAVAEAARPGKAGKVLLRIAD